EKLEPYGFERIHKSMLVNMNYVEDIDKNYIVLKSGERFLISRNLKTHVKQRFMDAVLKRW
ncbi:MAG TPA: LytTR family transcriptional regulator DNA-binding domain-containing protein, partial [Candidatus Monoglobus merdigallinarum]|nr:LytTR family transcriptional regulator DNA-binding domain-containing protein [Candidatus Monoglobus merdigallinarum]